MHICTCTQACTHSLSLLHIHTWTYKHQHSLSCTDTRTSTLKHTHTLSFFLSLTHKYTFYPFTIKNAYKHSFSISRSLISSFSFTLSLSHYIRLLLLLLLTLKEIECPREICCGFPLSSSLNLILSPSLSFLICVFEPVHSVSFSWFKVSYFFFVLSDRGIFPFYNQLNVTVAAFCKNFLFLFFEFVTFYSSRLCLTFSARCIFSTYL